jgi:glycerol kinase
VGCLIAIDAGTTGVRALAVDEAGAVIDVSYREIGQHFPRPGWVEHDPAEIWSAVAATVDEVARRQSQAGQSIAGIGITNQRETVVAWDRSSGEPRHRAIVWQDRRTAGRCDELRAAGHLDFVRAHTGLVLDPYFSATKMAWLLTEGGVTADADLVLGTVDSWVIWNLTGGPEGGALVTDPSNASRTLLYDIHAGGWSDELCELFQVPVGALPEVRRSSGDFGRTDPGAFLGLDLPIAGIAGDQQAALFGQACFGDGESKCTYGTGSFVLVNTGSAAVASDAGLLTTVAWDVGDGLVYALEGAVFVTGAAVQWLRDGLGIISSASETEAVARTVSDSGGVVFVPALTGLGAPHWDPEARGLITGITRGTTRAHLVRATLEAIAFEVRDVVDVMTRDAGVAIPELSVDGGAAANDLLCELQATQLQVPVRRPQVAETTALGAAFLAGLATGTWSSTDELRDTWRLDKRFEPGERNDDDYAAWQDAVRRAASQPAR